MPSIVSSPVLGTVLLAVVAVLIVALHRLKPRAGRQVVSSTLLWEAAARVSGQRQASWRWWLSLLLSLAIGLLLAVALSRPEVQGTGDVTRRVVVIVDNHPSMATRTRDGLTRWAHARAVAQGVVREAGGTVMILDSMGRAPSTGFLAPADALAALERIAVAPTGRAFVPPLPSVPGLEVHVVSDGVAALGPPSGAIVHSVFEPADNVAVTGLVTRALPADPTRVEALVQVVNASPVEKPVRLSVRGDGGFVLTQFLRMGPGERIDATYDVSAFEGGVLAAAALSPGDALPNDDIAYTVVAAHRPKQVLLVSRGNSMLADSLAALPGVRIDVIAPARYRDGLRADVFVFDGFTPATPPAAGALLFRPAGASWLPGGAYEGGATSIADWDRASPVAAGVAWNDVTVKRASVWRRLPPGAKAVARNAAGALVVAGQSGAPWVAVGFQPGESNLPLQPGFPVFLGNAISTLSRTDPVILGGLGANRVPLDRGDVRNGRGEIVASRHLPGQTLFEAERPDIYTVRAANGRVRVVAGAVDTANVEINRTRYGSATPAVVSPTRLPLERWSVLAIIGLVLLLVEWAAYTRRLAR